MLAPCQSLGNYNKKFIEDWKSKIIRVINKAEARDRTLSADIQTLLKNLDFSKKDTEIQIKTFDKVSQGSLFFSQYNSNDWNRIEVPGTSYRKF